MTSTSDQSARPTPVTILGRTYHLRGNEDPRYLQQLAGLVDRKMREVAEATGTADSLNVAILAALNLADDCLQARQGAVPANDANDATGADDGALNARLARMVSILDEALAS